MVNAAQRHSNARLQHRAEIRAGERVLSARDQFIRAMETAAANNPDIDPNVFIQIRTIYDEEYPNTGNINNRIASIPQGAQALDAIRKEMQPQGFFTPFIKQFYNSDKGGMQFAGIGGAAAAGGLVYYLTRGSNKLVNWGLTAAAAIAGSFIGNKLLGPADKPKPNFRTPAPANIVPTPLNPPPYMPPAQVLVQNNPQELSQVAMNGSQIIPAPLTDSGSGGFTPTNTPIVAMNGGVNPAGSRQT